MKTPETSRFFTRWRNPASGVESLILTERLAPVQRTFYFVNRSFTSNGRFLWLECRFVPRGGRVVNPVFGVIDFENDEFHVYHETQSLGTAMVDDQTGDLYFFNGLNLWKRGPLPNDEAHIINSFPADLAKRRAPSRIATHLTFSPDRKSVNMDALFGNDCYVGDIPLDGSDVRVWQHLHGQFDHAQFSPTENDVQMFAHEYWQDHIDDPFDHDLPYHRLWYIRRGEKARPILNQPVSHSGHEWWDPDGKHIWYVHYGVAIKKVEVATGNELPLWDGALSHGYSDVTGRYLVADLMADPVISDCHVAFRDTVTGKEVEIVNRPPLDKDLVQCGHLHPHPQFCMNDRYICHTTTIHDRVDIALVPTQQLIERTK